MVAARLGVPRNQVQSWLREGRVLVNRAPVKASSTVHAGDLVECRPPPPAVAELVPESGEIRVLYGDADLLVVDKPSDLVVHPGAGRGGGTLVHRLLRAYPDLAAVGHPARPGIVHRLDRNTTGALVVARTDLAYQQLSRAFAERRVVKVYLAIAHGQLPESGAWSQPIGRHPIDRKRMAVRPSGRPALTEFRCLDRAAENQLSLVGLRLHTGRTHQIRVHLKAAGYPLVGDPVYGEERWRDLEPVDRALVRRFPRPALHAWFVGLAHPRTGAALAVSAPIPEDLEAFWQALAGRSLCGLAVPEAWRSQAV